MLFGHILSLIGIVLEAETGALARDIEFMTSKPPFS